MDDKGFRRPIEGFPRVGILATGELDVEAAAEFTGFGRRSGDERADDRVAGPAAHPPEALLEFEFEGHLGLANHPPVGVDNEDQIPAVSAEFDAPGPDEDPGTMVATGRSGW
ncbi:hypothetical protein COW53_03500 [bacterium CG17_big_fil_post_rev_8_21_14_2_50_64_8]|nr:MAG: hypothetical protein COW53_03500 [bacterium CG17_big_fil_post_rev_8_21_14_2_50_64_8]PJA76081.1 MAG: hypothetical protein CO151_03890 [bacterium CG_4_9_14_3_um_filter_65_15]